MTHLLQNNGNDKTMIKQRQRHINYKTMTTTKPITMIKHENDTPITKQWQWQNQ